ncbi:hypothetical protein WJX72_000356 [[Myrmecia] bisecta]|uniref:Protein kinase domain-containing protein n=1 Tax=[Myrmecia] bisecta TaxID=41462 RepID=A0AAW1R3F5_9CHLO
MSRQGSALLVRPSGSIVCRMSSKLVSTYEQCSPPQPTVNVPAGRCLTKPSVGTSNDGYDNANSDLILRVGDVLTSSSGVRYTVQDMLGQGTFGQVVECLCEVTGETVAVKVIKNQTAFYHQARVEIGVLQFLNTRGDPNDQHHLVRLRDYFVYHAHLCLVFELLSVNLYELVKHNQFRGLSMNLLRVFISQILDALTVLRESNIIHCDLKPENVLLKGLDSGDIKVIDFGSACFENRTMYSYIQSRFYRSPEVLLGHPYDVSIDMWSLGCMAAELFLGLPLFPGASEHDLLVRIVDMLGMLPEKVLAKAAHTKKYFRKVEETVTAGDGTACRRVKYMVRSQAEFEALYNTKAPAGKRYFQHTKLADIIGAYPMKAGMSDVHLAQEQRLREAFLDFLLGVLDLDPATRWSPLQALQHPFITGAPFTGPFQPAPDPHMPARESPLNSHPMGVPIGSPYGLAVSPYFPSPLAGSMLATSPEAHLQAHAAAMAAIHAQFSPRVKPGVPAIHGSLPNDRLLGAFAGMDPAVAAAAAAAAAGYAPQQRLGGSTATHYSQGQGSQLDQALRAFWRDKRQFTACWVAGSFAAHVDGTSRQRRQASYRGQPYSSSFAAIGEDGPLHTGAGPLSAVHGDVSNRGEQLGSHPSTHGRLQSEFGPSAPRLQRTSFESHASVETPSDWDPLYSDDQLLNEEGQWRSSDMRRASSLSSAQRQGYDRLADQFHVGSYTSAATSVTSPTNHMQPSPQGPYDTAWFRETQSLGSQGHQSDGRKANYAHQQQPVYTSIGDLFQFP